MRMGSTCSRNKRRKDGLGCRKGKKGKPDKQQNLVTVSGQERRRTKGKEGRETAAGELGISICY